MPLYRRLPKRGFKNYNSKEIVAINVSMLNKFEDGAEVTIESLLENGIISNPKDGVKILGNGEPSAGFNSDKFIVCTSLQFLDFFYLY